MTVPINMDTTGIKAEERQSVDSVPFTISAELVDILENKLRSSHLNLIQNRREIQKELHFLLPQDILFEESDKSLAERTTCTSLTISNTTKHLEIRTKQVAAELAQQNNSEDLARVYHESDQHNKHILNQIRAFDNHTAASRKRWLTEDAKFLAENPPVPKKKKQHHKKYKGIITSEKRFLHTLVHIANILQENKRLCKPDQDRLKTWKLNKIFDFDEAMKLLPTQKLNKKKKSAINKRTIKKLESNKLRSQNSTKKNSPALDKILSESISQITPLSPIFSPEFICNASSYQPPVSNYSEVECSTEPTVLPPKISCSSDLVSTGVQTDMEGINNHLDYSKHKKCVGNQTSCKKHYSTGTQKVIQMDIQCETNLIFDCSKHLKYTPKPVIIEPSVDDNDMTEENSEDTHMSYEPVQTETISDKKTNAVIEKQVRFYPKPIEMTFPDNEEHIKNDCMEEEEEEESDCVESSDGDCSGMQPASSDLHSETPIDETDNDVETAGIAPSDEEEDPKETNEDTDSSSAPTIKSEASTIDTVRKKIRVKEWLNKLPPETEREPCFQTENIPPPMQEQKKMSVPYITPNTMQGFPPYMMPNYPTFWPPYMMPQYQYMPQISAAPPQLYGIYGQGYMVPNVGMQSTLWPPHAAQQNMHGPF